MEVSFEKLVKVSYDFDPIEISNYVIKSYSEEYGQVDFDILNYLDDHIYDILEDFGVKEEDIDEMMNLEEDVTYDLLVEVEDIIKRKFNFNDYGMEIK